MNTPIALTRKAADKACESLAEEINENADKLWEAALAAKKFEEWVYERGLQASNPRATTFWEALEALRASERAHIAAGSAL